MPGMSLVKTTCNRDCPDACGMLAEVEDGRVIRLAGDPDHPVTQGFLCYRTGRFLGRQYDPARILRPLLRRDGRHVEITLTEALDLAAERLLRIRQESGPAAIFHYRSGGSLGMLKMVPDAFFARFGPTTTKTGDICSGGGDAAQLADFGHEDAHDFFDLRHARHVINWGKNLFISNVHLIPLIQEVRQRGTTVTLIDPVWTKNVRHSDRYLQLRPGGDVPLALAVGQLLFQTGNARGVGSCDHGAAFEALCFQRPLPELLAEADVTRADAEHLARILADGPTAILVGWGLGRRLRGGSAVRLLDALCAVSGNLGVRGGGVSFYFKRRGAFDVSFIPDQPPPRVIVEPLLGEQVLAAKDPPIRALWVTAGNPVAMLPDSKRVAEAIERTEFSVVVDSHHTDTTRRATLVLPTTTMLEDDDLLGAYGHHWLGVSRPVVPPPEGVLTDLQIVQELARRTGFGDEFAGTTADWKRRLLRKVAPMGASLEALERGPVRNPLAAEVLFEGGRVPTRSGRVQLVHDLPPTPPEEPGFPLWLLSNSALEGQSSQWSVDPGPCLRATVHPDVARGVADGGQARLVSALGALTVTLRHDPSQRRDVVIVPKGGHYDRGQAANALIRARTTDLGDGAAYQDAHVRIEPIAAP
jgi:anaerobic selenocysteine-containing dehydrogenase